MDLGESEAGAHVSSPSVFVTEIEQPVRHHCKDIHVPAGVEEQSRSGSGQGWIDLRVLETRVLVSQLSFQADDAEVDYPAGMIDPFVKNGAGGKND